ncbi:MAG TPA: dihydrofolate reductase family protein [Terracidiphilus sp.]|jgi:dihydrofolate reductase
MRKLAYGVATSLDGFIAGPNGEYDWITPDSGIEFGRIYAKYDTLLMGRRTYDVAKTRPGLLHDTGMEIVVVSTTLAPAAHPNLTILASRVPEAIAAFKTRPGKDIWLMGGGVLFRSLLDSGLVDAVEVSVFPVLLGAGTPLLPQGRRIALHLESSAALPSGVLMLSYAVAAAPDSARAD